MHFKVIKLLEFFTSLNPQIVGDKKSVYFDRGKAGYIAVNSLKNKVNKNQPVMIFVKVFW